MNKKKFFNQLLEKKFIFLFVIISISIFFLTLNILNLKSSKLTVRVVPNSHLMFKTKTLFNNFIHGPQQADWLDENKLLENLLEHFSENKSHLKFRLFKKNENLSSYFLLIFDVNKQVNSNILDLLENSNYVNSTYVENRIYYTIQTYNKNLGLRAIIEKLNIIRSLTDVETELNKIEIIQSQAKGDIENLMSDVKKEKFFKFVELKKPEEVLKFDNKLIAFIISIFGAFLINIAISILIKYKKYT